MYSLIKQEKYVFFKRKFIKFCRVGRTKAFCDLLSETAVIYSGSGPEFVFLSNFIYLFIYFFFYQDSAPGGRLLSFFQ